MKKNHYVKREIIINAPRQKVFEFLRMLKNQDKFNKWAKTDPDRKVETKGTDGTIGYIYSWSGNKNAGVGAKEIKNIIEGERIETEIRFDKPMKVTASVIMETEIVTANQTKVNLINAGTLNFPVNLMIPMAERNFAKDMDESLSRLKELLEQEM
ncbi:MAG TPA: SRPBCC family protein [Bacteroidia bacterium]|nr:SRPBCC family protein [Bacteroidia bacterium]